MSRAVHRLRRVLKRGAQLAFFPVFRYFGPRFNNLYGRLDVVDRRTQDLNQRLVEFERSVSTDLETAIEFTLNLQRSTASLDRHLQTLQTLVHTELGKKLVELDPGVADYAAHLMVGRRVEEMGPYTAELLNWASAGDGLGFAAQAGLWFNPPITAEHRAGEVILRTVNERIVEGPYAMALAGDLAPGSRVLDVGASESTLSLSLACLGLQVTSIDPRPYPLEHPNLTVVVNAIEEWEGPEAPFEAIFCISTIEHLGVGAYGQSTVDPKLDRRVMDRMASWLSPGGQLVLTTPYGEWSVDGFQRIYDDEHLEQLLAGWKVLDRRICVQTSDLIWEMVDGEPGAEVWETGSRGVVLLRATPDL